nr:hypothetical protein [Pseudoxanthomonas sp.]
MERGRKIRTWRFLWLGRWAFRPVNKFQVQIHGYRKGHQLLATSLALPREDQATLDRLSDVAGPLRPREEFEPYLSAYPLPSASHYVIARTWQDSTVPRAGCVRTMSVLIEMKDWRQSAPIGAALWLLSTPGLPSVEGAHSTDVEAIGDIGLPVAPEFNASELLEAIFFEEFMPVAMFDAPSPDAIASRVLAALWPDIRSRFALSTFALSPRKIGGRDFDLVFAPGSAKSKFTGWPGRRIDGRMRQTGRHRWTNAVVRRVFEDPVPKLLSDQDVQLLRGADVQSTSALRIALLWNELVAKVERSPSAALGLLDIANSGLVNSDSAARVLESQVASAAQSAAETLSSDDAWDFASAMARKMQGSDMPSSQAAVENLVADLARRSPSGAIDLLLQPDSKGAIAALLPSIAAGIGAAEASPAKDALISAPPEVFARLLSSGHGLSKFVLSSEELIEKTSGALLDLEPELAKTADAALLPWLVRDQHLSVAEPIFARLDAPALMKEVKWLELKNGLAATELCRALLQRARELKVLARFRDALVSLEPSLPRDDLIEASLSATAEDARWVISEGAITENLAAKLLYGLLEKANALEFRELMSDAAISSWVIGNLDRFSPELLFRAALDDHISLDAYANIAFVAVRKASGVDKLEISRRALKRLLKVRFDLEEEVLPVLLNSIETQADARSVAKSGLALELSADVASRNLVLCERTHPPVRALFVSTADEFAHRLKDRVDFDLSVSAFDACARIMFDAQKNSLKAYQLAAGWLVGALLKARRRPVSLLIVALFPAYYVGLESDDVSVSFLGLSAMFGRDPKKYAREDLVDAYLYSSWKPAHLALTAIRCGDTIRIFDRLLKTYGGEEYLLRISKEISEFGPEVQGLVKSAIAEVRPKPTRKRKP